jgi:undecaprenyl diphosphate synthase
LSYGGRQDIVNAVLQVHEAIQAGAIERSEVTEKIFEQYLDTAGIPDPDLLIRTGGEQRLSNFLLWQSAYAELYFSSVLWPDFDDDEFMKAIEEYRSRQRRFGMISEQIEAEGRRS